MLDEIKKLMSEGVDFSSYVNSPNTWHPQMTGLHMHALAMEYKVAPAINARTDQLERQHAEARKKKRQKKGRSHRTNMQPVFSLNSATKRETALEDLEISIMGKGDRRGVKSPLWAPERGIDTFGAKLLIALDTEYQSVPPSAGESEKNLILSYQVVAATDCGKWCEIIFHVWNGHRMSLSEIINETRKVLNLNVKELTREEVKVISHFGVAEWAALRDRKSLARILQIVRKVPVTMAPEEILIRMNNRPVRINLSIADTTLLAPETKKSLAALGEFVGIDKIQLPQDAIEQMESLREEDRDLFELYGINDSRITMAYYLKMCRTALSELGLEKVPLTIGAMSVNTFINRAGDQNYQEIFGLEEEITYKKKKKLVSCDFRNAVEHIFTAGFCGGLNNATPGEVRADENRVVLDIDFTSAYPTAASMLPKIDWSGDGKNGSEYETVPVGDGYALSISCAFVEFEFPPDTSRPCIPIRHQKYGLIYPIKGRGYATGAELRLARSKGARIKIIRQEKLPHVIDDDGNSELAFARFLGEMVAMRARFPKGSLENDTYKGISNGFYGKLAQGLRWRVVRSFEKSSTLPPSKITCSPYATVITGIVRTALIELQDAIEEIGGVVHSATTDGCAASFAIPASEVESLDDIPGFWDAVLRKPGIQAMRQGLLNMQRDVPPLELKAIGDSCIIWKTRGYVIKRGDEVVHVGRAGHQLSAEKLEDHANAPVEGELREWTMTSLAGAQKIYDGKIEDLIRIKSDRKVNLDYDFKLIPTDAGGYRPPKDINEFLDWRETADAVRKEGRRASTTQVRLALANINQRGGQDQAIRRNLLRAIVQNLHGIRPIDFKDKEIAERLGMTVMDVKNAKRREYTLLPDLPVVRTLFTEMMAALGREISDIPEELLSRIKPEPKQ